MVAFDRAEYKNQAVSLWARSFGDSVEYINFFFENHACNCLTNVRDGVLTAQLFLIEGEICGRSGYYLFAACTAPEYRGQGCMAELLSKAEAFARQNGKAFIALVPAEKSLFDYYARFGYKTAFYYEKRYVNNLTALPSAERFVWCESHLDYIAAEKKRFATDYVNIGGELYAVFKDENGAFIKAPSSSGSPYGMMLPLADGLPERAYIGLTLE